MEIKKEKGLVKFELTFDKQTWEAELDKAYKKDAGKYKVQGFRAGKAPRGVIEKNYGTDTFVTPALQELMSRGYGEILDSDPSIKPVDYPTIDYKLDDKGITITGSVPVEPEVKLGKYTGHKVTKPEVKVTDADIDKYLTDMQENRARQVEAKADHKAKMGDVAVIDFVGYVEGAEFSGGKAENYELELGSNSFIDTFEKQLEGLKKGDKKDVIVTFPKTYHVSDLAGKEAKFEVTISKIMVKEMPKLDDAFAKESSEFDTMAKWREGIKKDIAEQMQKGAEANAENELVKAVVESTKIDVPPVMVERQIDAMVRDIQMRMMHSGLDMNMYLQYAQTTMEKMREDMKEQATVSVKTRLVFDAIIAKEGIEVSDKEVDAFQKEKKMKDEQKDFIKQDLLLGKLIDLLKEKNEVS